jgi:hypothetical protein
MVRPHLATELYIPTLILQRIGAFQPWGEVSRKKDKKPSTTHGSKLSTQSRGDSRGTRGGRGGRGGTRGRGGHPKASGNGHVPQAESTSTSAPRGDISNGTLEESKPDTITQITKPISESYDQQNGTISSSTSGRTDSSSQTANTIGATSLLGTALSRGHALEGAANGNASQTAHPHATRPPSKTPATSKLSWAQIAR